MRTVDACINTNDDQIKKIVFYEIFKEPLNVVGEPSKAEIVIHCSLLCTAYLHICYTHLHVLCVDDPSNGRTLLGTLDYAWLFSYAVAMFFR